MEAIGLCRFSYPALGGFQVEHASPQARARYLYAPARLEERFRLFETVALPALRAQSDQDFQLVILAGDDLPQPWADRLFSLAAPLPQVKIVQEPPQPHREVAKRVLNSARKRPDRPCLQFRFDDDDAVAVDFIARLRAAARDCDGLLTRHRSVAIDFNRGYSARFGETGIQAAEAIRPYYTAALGMMVRGGDQRTIMNFAHHKIHRFMPTVTFTDAPMWVRGLNGYNDSRQKPVAKGPLKAATPDLEALFAERFAIDAGAVRRAFSAVRNTA